MPARGAMDGQPFMCKPSDRVCLCYGRPLRPKTTALGRRISTVMIARHLNDRPRATFGFMKPSEKLAELLALTPWNRPAVHW